MKRRLFLGAFVLMAASLGVASMAFACQRLTTLSVTPKSGPAGTTVTVTGGNYNTATSSSPVSIRLDTRNGRELASVRPDPSGRIAATFKLTDVSPGYHVLLGTQTISSGAPAAGTPGRGSFHVGSGSASAGAMGIPSSLSTPAGVAAIAAAALIAGGVWYGARRRRSASTQGVQT